MSGPFVTTSQAEVREAAERWAADPNQLDMLSEAGFGFSDTSSGSRTVPEDQGTGSGGSRAVPGTAETVPDQQEHEAAETAVPSGSRAAVPGSAPHPPEPGTVCESFSTERPHPLYADIRRMLAEGLPEPEAPDVLTRSDGIGLFYRGQVNQLFGDPESGKTWVALAAVAETLRDGGSGLVLDLDHNGPKATIGRLLLLGAPADALSSLDQFRFVEPEDPEHLSDVVGDVIPWRPDVTVLDSVGELLPMFGANSNSADEFTIAHARIMKPLASKAGTALVTIDHLAKGSDSRAMGPTGTYAKKRAIGGVSLRVAVEHAFVPGNGGSAALTVHKDRHGGLRARCPVGDREPLAAMFNLSTIDGATTWALRAPSQGERAPDQIVPDEDVDAVASLDPPAESVEDARHRLGWRKQKAAAALREYRKQQNETKDAK